jgi:GT2 family glycosyltransferase
LRTIDDNNLEELPEITISFVTFNSSKWLQGLFESLVTQSYPTALLNIFFVDNDSTDDTFERIQSFKREHGHNFASITTHRQKNLGFGLGHDYSFRYSHDELVLISNVDLQFHRDSLIRVVKVALRDLDSVASWELRQCPYEHPKYYDPVTLETSWTSHACALIRRRAYLDVGGFEERIFMYGEDVELSYRFRGAGYKLRYVPWATVTHHVDFERTELRPNQLSGSVAANVLLRIRYGNESTSAEGLRLLENVLDTATNPERQKALTRAYALVSCDRDHFERTKRPTMDAVFPFNGFDYDVTRLGHNVPLASDEPIDRPLVSIITRTHGPNVSLLKEAIASVCNQTYRNIEHIIVEDRTDFAAGIAEDLRKIYGTDIRYIKSTGTGRSVAGNTGLAATRGELLMFLDNDDLLFADHVEILVRAMTRKRNTPAAYALGWEIPTFYDQNGRYREGAPIHVPGHATDFSTSRLRRMNFMPIQCVLFRRELFET